MVLTLHRHQGRWVATTEDMSTIFGGREPGASWPWDFSQSQPAYILEADGIREIRLSPPDGTIREWGVWSTEGEFLGIHFPIGMPQAAAAVADSPAEAIALLLRK